MVSERMVSERKARQGFRARLGLGFGMVFAAALGLAGCSLPIQAPHTQETWRLESPRVTTPPVQVEGKTREITVLLRPIKAAQGLESSAMMYSRAPQILAPYRDNRWLAPPAEMIGDALGQTLANQPWVAGVLRTGGAAKVQISLDCRVETLEHDIHATQGEAHLVMDCLWLDPSTRRIQAHWRFDQTLPLAQNAAADFAAGAQALLNRAGAEIVQQTRALVPQAAGEDASD